MTTALKLLLTAYTLIALIPVIALIDWLIFKEKGACYKCNAKPKKYSWLMACFLEIMLFVLGLFTGYVLGITR